MKSQYDLWLEAEQNKIHQEYEEKRQELFGKSFLAGMNGKNKQDEEVQSISAQCKELDKQEQAAVDEFMRQIQSK